MSAAQNGEQRTKKRFAGVSKMIQTGFLFRPDSPQALWLAGYFAIR